MAHVSKELEMVIDCPGAIIAAHSFPFVLLPSSSCMLRKQCNPKMT